MLKTATAAITVLLAAASPVAFAQNAPAKHAGSSTADSNMLTDVRVHVVKAALQLTPEQEKYWPAVEQAIRQRAKERQERVAKLRERVEQLRDAGPAALVNNRNPVDFLNRRADALAQRSASLKKLADAWEPLYRTLDPDQKRRMRFVTMLALAKARQAVEHASTRDEDFDDE